MSAPERFDVAVVGGGPAGFAAALGAARAGARTLLLEREGRLGGNATQALVHTICGLYRNDEERAIPAHVGLPVRVAAALERLGGAGPPTAAGRVFYLPMQPAAFGALAHDCCERASGLELRTGTALTGLRLGESPELVFVGPQGESRAVAHSVVDASGDAAAAALAGADSEATPPARLQRASYIVRLDGVTEAGLAGFARLQLTAGVARAASRGELPAECASVVAREGGCPGSLFLTLTLPPLAGRPFAPLDADYVAEQSTHARTLAATIVDFLRATREGFAAAGVADWPARIGIRETRRALGRVVLERDDVLEGRRRDDEVAVSSWPIELWEDHRRARFEHPEGPCSVPLGALVSRSHPNLGMAGRCLSASHEAHGALRVIGTALATGEAIGVAAALAADARSALADVAPGARARTHPRRRREGAAVTVIDSIRERARERPAADALVVDGPEEAQRISLRRARRADGRGRRAPRRSRRAPRRSLRAARRAGRGLRQHGALDPRRGRLPGADLERLRRRHARALRGAGGPAPAGASRRTTTSRARRAPTSPPWTAPATPRSARSSPPTCASPRAPRASARA